MRIAASVVLVFAAAAGARPLVSIDFDAAPSALPPTYYHALGVDIALSAGQPGPTGFGEVSIVNVPAGLPSPAAGKGITPYANLAGYLGPFELTFPQAIDSFSLWAFDGPQAFTVRAYRFGTQVGLLDIPAEPGRVSLQLMFGAVGGPLRIDRVVVNPVPGIGGSDPNRGPKYYDALQFNIVPAPGAAPVLLLGLLARRRRR